MTNIDALRDRIYRGYIRWHNAKNLPEDADERLRAAPWRSFNQAGWRGVKSCDENAWQLWTHLATTIAEVLAGERALTDELFDEAVAEICAARLGACPGLKDSGWPFGMLNGRDVEAIVGTLSVKLAKRARKNAPAPIERPRPQGPQCGGTQRALCNRGRGCGDCRSYWKHPAEQPAA